MRRSTNRNRFRLRRRGRIIKVTAAVLAAVLFLIVLFVVVPSIEKKLNVNKDYEKNLQSVEEVSVLAEYGGSEVIYREGKAYQMRTDLSTLLFMGVDKFNMTGYSSIRNNEQSDFLLLLVHDEKTGETIGYHLNRDTMAYVTTIGIGGRATGTQYEQLAFAHTYGSGREDSCMNVVSTVENLFYGIQIDHYIAITMDAISILNDWVGGVSLEIRDDFPECPELVKGTVMRLEGDQALTYIRARLSMAEPTNLARMERQRQYIDAWLVQAQENLSSTSKVAEVVQQLDNNLLSDMTASDMSAQIKKMDGYLSGKVVPLEGKSVVGKEFMEYYVDEDALQELVLNMFYKPVDA